MKRILVIACLLLPFLAAAQNDVQNDSITSIVEKIVDRKFQEKKFKSKLNVDFCSSVNGYFTENQFDELTMKLNRLRFDLRGGINEQFSYRVRYSFNKSFSRNSTEYVPSALEYANIQWHPTDRFKLTVGKQFLVIGGYEALENSMYVREFSEFNNNLSFYRLAVTGSVKLDQDKNHELQLQISNNRAGKDSDIYSNGLPEGVEPTKFPFMSAVVWNGYFADKALNLVYGASVAPVAKDNYIYYLSAGNILRKGPFFAYFDAMYSHESIDTQQRITGLQGAGLTPVTAQNVDYLTLIARFDYRFNDKWNLYVKGAYETSNVYKSNGIFEAGRYMENWNAQTCLEWYPFGMSKGFRLFAHYLYKGCELENLAKNTLNAVKPDIQRVSLGVLYVIPVL